MSNQQLGSVRRKPRQARAQAAVAAIKASASVLLEESGFDNLTTSAIADHARVNIATLYRYYPNKFTIVRELAEELEGERSAVSVDALRELRAGKDWRGPVQRAISGVADLRLRQPAARAIRRALTSSPALWDLDHEVVARTATAIAPYLRQVNPALEEQEADDIALVVVHTVTGLLDLVNDDNELAPRVRAQANLMIERYLSPYLDVD